jgi:hypothetical protein
MAKNPTRLPYDIELTNNLQNHPVVCGEIGLFIGAFAGMEVWLWRLYCKILGHGDEVATMDLLGSMTFHYRIEAVKRYLEHADKETRKHKARYLELLSQASQINRFRNLLAHGIYGQTRKGELWLHSGYADPGRPKTETLHLEVGFVGKKAAEARKIGHDIVTEFFPKEPWITFHDK